MIDQELLQEMAEKVSDKIASGKNFKEAIIQVLAYYRIFDIQQRKFCFREIGRILGSRNKRNKK